MHPGWYVVDKKPEKLNCLLIFNKSESRESHAMFSLRFLAQVPSKVVLPKPAGADTSIRAAFLPESRRLASRCLSMH
jgi:hypothetical protein